MLWWRGWSRDSAAAGAGLPMPAAPLFGDPALACRRALSGAARCCATLLAARSYYDSAGNLLRRKLAGTATWLVRARSPLSPPSLARAAFPLWSPSGLPSQRRGPVSGAGMGAGQTVQRRRISGGGAFRGGGSSLRRRCARPGSCVTWRARQRNASGSPDLPAVAVRRAPFRRRRSRPSGRRRCLRRVSASRRVAASAAEAGLSFSGAVARNDVRQRRARCLLRPARVMRDTGGQQRRAFDLRALLADRRWSKVPADRGISRKVERQATWQAIGHRPLETALRDGCLAPARSPARSDDPCRAC